MLIFELATFVRPFYHDHVWGKYAVLDDLSEGGPSAFDFLGK